MDSVQRGTSYKSYLIWSDHITGRAKTVLPDRKKKDRSAKLFCKVKITLILCKALHTPQRDTADNTGLSEMWQRVQKNKSYWTHVWKRGSVGVFGWGNGRVLWGIIELQWPHDSTIGEVMCWINSVPDPVFGRAVILGWPPGPKGEATVTHLSELLLPAKKRHSDWQPGTWRPMENHFVHCMLICSANTKALYTLGHSLNKLLFLFVGIHQRHQM